MYNYGGLPERQVFLKLSAFRRGLLITAVPTVSTSIISVALKIPGFFLVGAICWFLAIAFAIYLSAMGHRQAAEGASAGFLIGSLALFASFLVVAGAFG